MRRITLGVLILLMVSSCKTTSQKKAKEEATNQEQQPGEEAPVTSSTNPNELSQSKIDNAKSEVNDDIIKGKNESLDGVTDHLNLVKKTKEFNVSWRSNNNVVLTSTGQVTRPEYGDGNQNVTLTATFIPTDPLETNGLSLQSSIIKTFKIVVLQKPKPNQIAVTEDINQLTLLSILGNNNNASQIIDSLSLPRSGPNGSAFSWSSSSGNVGQDGSVVSPDFNQTMINVTLTLTATKGSAVAKKQFQLSLPPSQGNDEDVAQFLVENLSIKDILGRNQSQESITSNLSNISPFEIDLSYGGRLRWELPEQEYLDLLGVVSRPAFSIGNIQLILTATVLRGTAVRKKSFNLTVIKLPPTPEESVDLALEDLTVETILKDNNNSNEIRTNLNLSSSGNEGTTITWASSDESVVSIEGTVVRPSKDVEVTLTAKVSKSGVEKSKEFTLTVLEIETP